MAQFKQYETKNGKKWEFIVYAGRDELNGSKRNIIHRRGFDTKKAASLAASKALLDSNANGRTVMPSHMTFRELYKEWDAGYINTVRESTYYKTSCAVKVNFLPALGDKQLSKITPGLLQRLVNSWAKKSSSAFREWVSKLKRIFRYAEQCGYINGNPARLIQMPKPSKQEEQKAPNFWTKQELNQFLNAIDGNRYPEQLAFFRTLAFSGIRKGEASALTWADISFSDNTISITKTVAKGAHGQVINKPKTEAGTRVVDMDPESMNILQRWHIKQLSLFMAKGMNVNKPTQLVFPSKSNRFLWQSTAQGWLDYFAELAGMNHKIRLHGFRHTHASMLAAMGVPAKVAQVRLGHKDVQTTLNIYTHVTPQQTSEVATKLAKYFNLA